MLDTQEDRNTTPVDAEYEPSQRRARLFPVGLTVITVVAAVLRLWSLDFGLPLITHPDEPLIFNAASHQGRSILPLCLVVIVLATPQVISAARWNIATGVRDTRYAALDWIEANIPRDAVIVREWHTPPLAQDGYHDVFIRATYEHPLAWYENLDAQYLVLSSFMYQRYLDAPDTYPVESAFYRAMLTVPRMGTFTGRNGPVIIIIRLQDAAAVLTTD